MDLSQLSKTIDERIHQQQEITVENQYHNQSMP